MPVSFLLLFALLADPAVDAGIPAPLMEPTAWPIEARPLSAIDAGVHAAEPVHLEVPPTEPAENQGRVKLRAAAESSLTSFPSGTPGGGQDAFIDLRPILGISIGEDFGIEVGAQFRLRLIDNEPAQRAGDIGGALRRADWDEASDFGQILRSLTINNPDSAFWVQAGSVRKKTLGLGHLISRYSNQDNPDYHPAGAAIGAGYKAIRAELFVSDIFGARIFAGETVADLGRIFGSTEGVFDRFHLAFSLAHDAGRAGTVAPSVTLYQLDFDAVLYRSAAARIMALAGLGARLADAVDSTGDLGLVVGISVDATLEGGFSIGGKAEVRKQQSGFRQGFFGPGYELSRFASIGFSGPSQAAEQLPDGFSFVGELHLASGTAVSFDFALEHFTWNRTDVDAVFSLEVINQRLIAGARFTAVGLGKIPRYATTSELRLRLFSSFYVLAAAGTVFFPQPDGTLVRGIYAGVGAGLDFER